MVWGCFYYKCVENSHIIDGQYYITILKSHLFETVEKLRYLSFKMIHPKHTGNIVKRFIEENNITTLPKPPQSLDLDPIKNLWDELDHSIS